MSLEKCDNCGAPNPSDKKTCHKCGNPTDGAQSTFEKFESEKPDQKIREGYLE